MHHLVTRALPGLFLAAGITVLVGPAQDATYRALSATARLNDITEEK